MEGWMWSCTTAPRELSTPASAMETGRSTIHSRFGVQAKCWRADIITAVFADACRIGTAPQAPARVPTRQTRVSAPHRLDTKLNLVFEPPNNKRRDFLWFAYSVSFYYSARWAAPVR